MSIAVVSLWVAAAVGLALYALYRHLLPKPIPGIPYNPVSARAMLGDVPSLLRDPDGMTEWLLKQAASHPGPVCQVFLQPGGLPFVLMSDFRESQDVLVRRGREWDRSDWTIDVLGALIPKMHINLKTGPEWRAHRKLLQDLMTPGFLGGVAAPLLYAGFTNLVELWGARARLARGRPFAAAGDLHHATLDAVLAFTFGDGYPHRATPPQIAHVLSLLQGGGDGEKRVAGGGFFDVDEPVEMSEVPVHEAVGLMAHWTDNVKLLIDNPFPRAFWRYHCLKPSEIRFRRDMSAFITGQIGEAVARLESEERRKKEKRQGGPFSSEKENGHNGKEEEEEKEDTVWVGSAVDMMVHREKRLAEKDGREPMLAKSEIMEQEIVGFVIAGHDTSSTTLQWGVKLLADHPTAQTRLRRALQAAYPAALAERRPPSAQEITKAGGAAIPRLDATVEEILRHSATAPFVNRSCVVPGGTSVLGHHVPMGTTLLMTGRGASIFSPALPIDEGLRSESSRKVAPRPGWDDGDVSEFRPERWLVRPGGGDGKDKGKSDNEDDDGDYEGWTFDQSAGPNMPFGLGLRACFGRRLAYLELRMAITLLIWNFELLPCPPALSGYGAVDGLTRMPKQCYVRLRPTGLTE